MRQTNIEHDLRFLYENVKKMLQSDDMPSLYKSTVEELVSCIGFERIIILHKNSDDGSLESQIVYGFQSTLNKQHTIPLREIDGLLLQACTSGEPFVVYDFPDTLSSSDAVSRRDSLLDNVFQGDYRPNRRAKISLCLSRCPTPREDPEKSRQLSSYSIKYIDTPDKHISSLLGEISSFLILPLSDDDGCYGLVLADNGPSGPDISFDRTRHAATVVRHATMSLKCITDRQRVIDTIGRQIDEADRRKIFYHNIFLNLRNALTIIDQDMNITETNRAVERVLGYGHDELASQPVSILFADPKIMQQRSYEELLNDIRMGADVIPEVFIQKKDGSTFPAEVCFSAIINGKDDISGISCSFRDLTNRKALEQDYARVDRLASLGELAAGMAHEIKNPLAGIAGALQIMAKNYEEESQQQYIFNEVLEQVKRIDSFVKDLLNFARPGKTTFKSVDLKEILDTTLILLIPQIRDKHANIKVDLCDTRHSVMGDDKQLQQVLLNIILNAIDTMDTGGTLTISSYCDEKPEQNQTPTASSTPSCAPPAGKINIYFTDTGKGIAPEMLESIFNPFHTTKSNGKGLGLPIAARIIEQHGGTISVESELGVGSSFTVQLPLCGEKERVEE